MKRHNDNRKMKVLARASLYEKVAITTLRCLRFEGQPKACLYHRMGMGLFLWDDFKGVFRKLTPYFFEPLPSSWELGVGMLERDSSLKIFPGFFTPQSQKGLTLKYSNKY